MTTIARRNHQKKLRDAHDELMHVLNGRDARQQEQQEQAARINFQRMFQVREELQRIVHRREADAAIAQERQRRLSNPATGFHPVEVDHALKAVQEELVRRFAVKVAVALMQAEKQRRVASNQYEDVVGELTSKAARRTAAQAEAAEQCRRLSASEVPVESSAKNDLHEAVVRAVHRAQVLKKMEAERQRRLLEVQHAAAMDELVRRSAVSQADAAMAVEQAQRVQADRMHDVLERLVKTVNAKHADQAAEEERHMRMAQDLRLQAHEELHRYLAGRLAAGLIHQAQAEANVRTLPAPSDTHTQLCEAVISAASARQVSSACQLEQAQRIAQDTMQAVVLPTLLSLLNRRAVKALAILEQSQRIAQEEMQARVLPQLQRRASQTMVHASMEAERQARVAKDNSDVVLHDLLRVVSAQQADQSMVAEQNDRIAQDLHASRLTQLHRELHSLFADVAMLHERERRLSQPLHGELPAQDALRASLQRHFDIMNVTQAAVKEQQAQVAERWLTLEVLPQLERVQAGRRADAAMVVEQAQRVQADRMHDVLEQLVKTVNAKHADQVAEEERHMRMAQETFHMVMSQLVRQASWLQVQNRCEQEREQRVQRDRFAVVAEELFRYQGRKAAQSAIKEFQLEMGLMDSFQPAPIAALEVSEANQELHDELLTLVAARSHIRSVHTAAMLELQQHVIRKTMQSSFTPVLVQLVAQAHRKQSQAQETEEQTRRVQANSHGNVMEAIRRALAWKQADDAMDREKRARVSRNDRLDRDCQLERVTNAAHADAVMDVEQTERVELGDIWIGLRNDDQHVLFREAIVAEAHRRQSLAAERMERALRMSQQSYNNVMAQLESRRNREMAQAVALHEQARATHAQRLEAVLEKFVAQVHRAKTAKACQAVLATAINKRVMDRVVAQLQAQSNRQLAAEMEEAERCRRLREPLPVLPLALLQAQEEAASKARRKQLDQVEAAERAERVHRDKFDPVLTQLTRQASLTTVKSLVAAEQADRVIRVEYSRALEQLVAVQHRKAACKATQQEQKELAHHPRVADPNIAQQLSTLQEQLLHAVNGKKALQLESVEQERRHLDRQRSNMFEELYRAVNVHEERMVSKDARGEWLGLLKSSSPDIKRRHSDVMIEMQMQVATQE